MTIDQSQQKPERMMESPTSNTLSRGVDSPGETLSSKKAKREYWDWNDHKQRMRVSVGDTERMVASKKISYILRHGQRNLEIPVDDDGWIKGTDLLTFMTEPFDPKDIQTLLSFLRESNEDKIRYEIRGEDSIMEVRANRKATEKVKQPKSKKNDEPKKKKKTKNTEGGSASKDKDSNKDGSGTSKNEGKSAKKSPVAAESPLSENKQLDRKSFGEASKAKNLALVGTSRFASTTATSRFPDPNIPEKLQSTSTENQLQQSPQSPTTQNQSNSSPDSAGMQSPDSAKKGSHTTKSYAMQQLDGDVGTTKNEGKNEGTPGSLKTTVTLQSAPTKAPTTLSVTPAPVDEETEESKRLKSVLKAKKKVTKPKVMMGTKPIDENLFFKKYGLDDLARKKLHELSEEKQQEAMRKFNPVKSIQAEDYPKVFMTYIKKFKLEEDAISNGTLLINRGSGKGQMGHHGGHMAHAHGSGHTGPYQAGSGHMAHHGGHMAGGHLGQHGGHMAGHAHGGMGTHPGLGAHPHAAAAMAGHGAAGMAPGMAGHAHAMAAHHVAHHATHATGPAGMAHAAAAHAAHAAATQQSSSSEWRPGMPFVPQRESSPPVYYYYGYANCSPHKKPQTAATTLYVDAHGNVIPTAPGATTYTDGTQYYVIPGAYHQQSSHAALQNIIAAPNSPAPPSTGTHHPPPPPSHHSYSQSASAAQVAQSGAQSAGGGGSGAASGNSGYKNMYANRNKVSQNYNYYGTRYQAHYKG